VTVIVGSASLLAHDFRLHSTMSGKMSTRQVHPLLAHDFRVTLYYELEKSQLSISIPLVVIIN
jgi:hypothetical protein